VIKKTTKIPSEQIPQADKLDEVGRLVEATAIGTETFHEFAAKLQNVLK